MGNPSGTKRETCVVANTMEADVRVEWSIGGETPVCSRIRFA